MRSRLERLARLPAAVQIAVVIAVMVIIVRVVNFTSIAFVIRHNVDTLYTERLEEQADLLHALVARQAGTTLGMHGEMWNRRHSRPGSPYLWEVTRPGSAPLRSPLLAGQPLPDLGPAPGIRVRLLEVPGHGPYLIVQDRRAGPAGRPTTVRIALAEQEIAKVNARINNDRALIYGFSVLLLVPLVLGGMWWAIRPLRRLAREVEAVTKGEAPEIAGRYPSDIQPVVDMVNRLIRRSNEASEHVRLQAMAAGHNIRSSLSEINLRIARLVNDDPVMHREIINNIEAIKRFLGTHLHRLNMIRGSTTPQANEVGDLEAFIDRVFSAVQRLYVGRGLEWRLGVGPNAVIRMESRDLGEILFNLLDNAGKWAATTVQCDWTIKDGWLEVEVQDDGPGLRAPNQPGHDDAPRPGLGLGLKISIELVRLSGGQLIKGSGQLGGASLRLRLPLAPIDPDARSASLLAG